jgi:hypothetical protein
MRSFVCAVLTLAILAGTTALAAEKGKKGKKKGKGLSGQITKIDAEMGTITVKVKLKKKQTEDREFKVTDATTVTAIRGRTKTGLKADKVADLLKKDQFKVGAFVTIQADEEGTTAKAITIGKAARKGKKKTKTDA